MTQVIADDVSAITPMPKIGRLKSLLIDLNPEMGTRAKQDFPKISPTCVQKIE